MAPDSIEKAPAPSKVQLRGATKTRKISILIATACLILSVIFLILVETGSINTSSPVAKSTYFVRLDTSDVIPEQVPQARLINSIAQSIGLHDFYQVGLWNYCAGYESEGVTECSKTQLLYWFNPVEVMQNDLLEGAVIQLPQDIIGALDLLRLASNWMFGLFLTGAVLETVMAALGFLALYSRLFSIIIAPLTFFAALLTTIAAVLATAIFIILKKAATSVSEVNLKASLGTKMFVFVWLAAAFAMIAGIIQVSLLCCCTSRRHARRSVRVV